MTAERERELSELWDWMMEQGRWDEAETDTIVAKVREILNRRTPKASRDSELRKLAERIVSLGITNPCIDHSDNLRLDDIVNRVQKLIAILDRKSDGAGETKPTDEQPATASHGRVLYERETANHPDIHCNRFPAWSELKDADKARYEAKAATLAEPTPNPSAEAVAWMYEYDGVKDQPIFTTKRWPSTARGEAWTETPLYAAAPTPEPLSASPWRDISTAPRDGGKEILLRVKYRAGIPGCMVVGHYMPGGHCIDDHPPISEGWYFWNGCMFDKACDPTHWTPLPPGPTMENSK